LNESFKGVPKARDAFLDPFTGGIREVQSQGVPP